MELEVGEGEVQMCLICVDCEGVIFLTLTLTLTLTLKVKGRDGD